MAKELGDLIVRLSLDSSKFDDALSRLETQMTKVQTSFRSSSTGLTDFDKVVGQLKTSAETLTSRMQLQKEKVDQLEKSYEESKRVKGEDAEETKKLGERLEEARGKLAQTEQALGAVNSQIKLNQNGCYQLGVNLENVGAKLQKAGQSMTRLGTKLSLTVTAPIVALGTKAIQSGMEFESAFAGVRKTVSATEPEFKDLSDSIKAMSERIPASTSELSGIMELAGQLGVKGTDNLKKFTEVIAALGVSTNLTQEEAATMFAQFANITGMDMGSVDKLGSTIVALGNNFATTENDIMQMSMRLAGAGSQLNMSEPQIVAFATALSSVGIEAEAGGSAFSKLMINMKVAAETGMQGKQVIEQTGMSLRDLQLLADQDGKAFKALAGKMGLTTTELKGFMSSASDLDQFAAATGMTAEQFAKAYGEDAAGAMISFLKGLKNIEDNGGSAILTLDEMGITEVRLRDAILRATGATDLFADAQGMANTAWEENTALQNEANQRYGTTESQLTMLGNAANNLAIQFSEVMIPVMMKVVDKLRGLIEWLQGLSAEQKETIVKVAAVAAAIGPLLVVLGKVVSSVGTIMKVMAPLAKAIGGSQTSVGLLAKAFALLIGPVGIVVAAIAGLVAIFVTLYNTKEEFRAKMDAVWAQICAAFENVKAVFEATFARFKESMEPVKEALGKLWETVQSVFLQIWNFLEPLLATLGIALGAVVTVVIGVANGILNALGPLIEAVVNAVDVVMNIIGAVIALLNGDFSGAWTMIQNALASFGDFFVNLWNTLGAFFQGFWEGICAVASAFGINLGTFFSDLWTGICTAATVAWTAFTNWLNGLWQGVCDGASAIWDALTAFFSGLWDGIKTGATTAWNSITSAISGAWDTFKTTASTAWNTICTNVKNAVDTAKAGIQTAWTTISTGISAGWETLNPPASTVWTGITTTVSSLITGAKEGIVNAWESIKSGVKTVWDGVTGIFKAPIEAVSTWLTEKVAWFKGLFSFEWKLPSFKLPKIEVKWNEIGWGIKLPSLSLNWNALGGIFDKPTIFGTANAGLQGVGEAGPEAILPLNTLWQEMSARLRQGMREVLREADQAKEAKEESLLAALVAALGNREPADGAPNVQVTQHIYANETSYAAQQREAVRQFRQIARAMG